MIRSLPIKLHLGKIVFIMIILMIIFILEPYKLRLESVQEWFNHHLKYTKNYQQDINISNIPKYTKNYQEEVNISNLQKYTKNNQQVVNKTVANKSDANEDILETKEAEKLDIVKQVDDWGNGVRFAQWQHPSEVDKNFSEDWVTLLQTFLQPGCNIVDIGAHGGDTTIPLAVASRGGTVVAVEMGPPYDLLTINARLNPQLHIHVYRKAVSNREGFVYYHSGCNGCNGGISSTGHTGTKVESVRLSSFLHSLYPDSFIRNICLVKIDTEGHDAVILDDIKDVSPAVVWLEWFADFKVGTPGACSQGSRKIFDAATRRGYVVFGPTLPLKKVPSCQNKYYQRDLLLIRKDVVDRYLP